MAALFSQFFERQIFYSHLENDKESKQVKKTLIWAYSQSYICFLL